MCTHLSDINSKYLKTENRSKARPTPIKLSKPLKQLLTKKEVQAKINSTS